MPNIAVVDMQGKSVGTMELSEEIFAVEPNTAAMHLVVRSYLAAQRQGTQSALTRGMVRGGGRKIYRQKGTGNARHHSNRAPQFRHGGVVFAPQPRDYVIKVPRKIRRLAMKSALSAQFNLLVVPQEQKDVVRASKNLPKVKDAYVNTINVYDLLKADKIVVAKAAMQAIQEVYA